ncbi:MAG: hypothetical protein NTY98_19910 [Verrucomicrobia bacterium]|nr:hypothetical protein [Verrucomicrobiota bacterium]
MKRILIYAFSVSVAFCQSAMGQTGYGVMGVPPAGYGTPPPGYGTPPPSVPAYPNSLPPASVTPAVTAPPGYADPYAAAPQPGQVSSYAPQGVSNYSSPPSGTAYGATAAESNMVNFRNAEAYYRYLAPKHSNLSGASTIGGALSLELSSLFYLKFGASWGSGTDNSGPGGAGGHAKYHFASVQAGAGFHTQLTNRLTFVAEAGMVYANLKASNSSVSFSDGSIYIRPALRYTPLDWLELQTGVTVSSADKYDSKMLDFTGYFRVLPKFDVGLGGDFGNTSRAFRATMRLRW